MSDPSLIYQNVESAKELWDSCESKYIETRRITQVDAIAWWIDFGAPTHVCKDRCWFKTYEPVEDGFFCYMGNDYFAPIHGKGSVVLEFSSRKYVTLFNVLYVPKLRFSYYNNGMFMLNLNKLPDDSGSIYMSSSIVNNFSLWHAHLGHVHYKRMLEMSKDDLIPAIDENTKNVVLLCCMAVVRLPDTKRKTLGEKGIDCIFVGYAEISRHIGDHSNDVPSETPKPHKGKRARKAKSYEIDFQLYLVKGSRDQIGSQYSYCYSIKEDPRTYNEGIQSQDVAFWKEAIDDEISSIMENNTWVLFDLPPGCKPLGCKWIFKMKMKVDGTIDKFKARLVIQGFR
ncbi:zinc finger, CCHC-type containing protein [Tanacetum coccineum]